MRKYKLFGKLPVFDLIVIVVLLVAFILCFKVFNTSNTASVLTETQTKTIRYTVDFTNLSELIKNLPEQGEKVYDNTTNSELGKVVSSESLPFVLNSYNDITGEPVSTVCKDRHTIRVVAETTANVSDRGIEINGVKIGIGRNLTLNMPSLCATGIIKNIEEVVK